MNSANKGSLNDNMSEISRTLINLKVSQKSLMKDIEGEEIYKEKLLQKLEEYKKDLSFINGNFSTFISWLFKYKKGKIYFLHIESLSDKNSLLEVYEKILKDSDSAYSKVINWTTYFLFINIKCQIVQSTESLIRMINLEDKKLKSTTLKPKTKSNINFD